MITKKLNRPLRESVLEVHTHVQLGQSVEEALELLRSRQIEDEIVYIYVVDEEGVLKGVLSTRKLLLSPSKACVDALMEKRLVTLQADQTLQEAMTFLEAHQLLALPVVDQQGHLLGVIDVGHYLDDKIDVAKSRKRSNIFEMLGFYVEEGTSPSPWRGYRLRMPWTLCNMTGGLLCAIISHMFEDVLARVLILAMFIPLVLSLSESLSMQSMAQGIQLVRRGLSNRQAVWSALTREWKIVGLIALSSGLLVGSLSLFWGEHLSASCTIAITIVFSASLSAFLGSIIPLLLHARRWDPRLAAGPLILMFADVLTTSFYLLLGSFLIL